MAFEVGHKKMGGRPKGTGNKSTAAYRQFLITFLNGDKQLFKSDWLRLSPAQRCAMRAKFTSYIVPSLGQTTLDLSKIDIEKLTDDQIGLLADQINLKAV